MKSPKRKTRGQTVPTAKLSHGKGKAKAMLMAYVPFQEVPCLEYVDAGLTLQEGWQVLQKRWRGVLPLSEYTTECKGKAVAVDAVLQPRQLVVGTLKA